MNYEEVEKMIESVWEEAIKTRDQSQQVLEQIEWVKRSMTKARIKELEASDNGATVICPQCKVEWNRLTPKGVCCDCEQK